MTERCLSCSDLQVMLIRHKLILGSCLLILLTAMTGGLCLALVRDAQKDLVQLNVDLVPHSAAATRMVEALLLSDAKIQELVSSIEENGNPANGTRDIVPLVNGKMEEIQKGLTDFQQAVAECRDIVISNGLQAAQADGDPAEIQSEYDELEKLDRFDKKSLVLQGHLDDLGGLFNTNLAAASVRLKQEIHPRVLQLLPQVQDYRDNIWGEMKSENLQMDSNLRHIEVISFSSTSLLLVVAVTISLWIWGAISKPITSLRAAVERLRSGEMGVTVPVTSRDELGVLGQAFNQMTRDLQHTTVSRDYVDNIIRSMGDMLTVTQLDGRIKSVNNSLLQSLGYTEDELSGKPIEVLLHQPQIPIDESFHRNLEAGGVRHFEAAYRHKNGRTVPVAISVSALHGRASLLHGEVWIAKDITIHKEAEAELAKTHKQLLMVSRQAGMAEVATGVLHNVGNVLNSLNVSSGIIVERLRKSKLGNVGRIGALLEEHSADLPDYLTRHPAGRQLPGYIKRLAERLNAERDFMRQEAEQVLEHVEHIREIVAMQQNYARVFGITEKIDVAELVEDSLRINSGSLSRHGVEVIRDYGPQPISLTVDRHKVLQIMVNLIRNAKYACDESDRKEKQLTLRIIQDGEMIKIVVKDNGVGIPPENMPKIFRSGFTTRKNGHGFGLHSAALAAKEMKGRLSAQSEGVQQGATFTLELPLQPPS